MAGARARGLESGLRAGVDHRSGPEADARMVSPRRAPAFLGAFRAQRAAGDARACGTYRIGGTVICAGRIPCRNAHRRDRIPLSSRGGHQAVSRRPARFVLRQRGHVSRSSGRRSKPGLGVVAAVRSGALEARPGRGAGAPVRFTAGHRVAHRVLSGAGGRVCNRLACAIERARDHHSIAQSAGAGGDGAVDAFGTVPDPVLRAPGEATDCQRLAGPSRAVDSHRGANDGSTASCDRMRLRTQRPKPGSPARGRGHRFHCSRFRPGESA